MARSSRPVKGNAMRANARSVVMKSCQHRWMLAAPLGAFAQDSSEPAATFNERFPADQTSTRPPLKTPGAKKEQNVTTTTRIVSAKRARSRVVVRARSFLDAGTEVLPVSASSSITPFRRPMLRWRWSPIPAGA